MVKPEIFISYAWEKHSQKIAKKICASLVEKKYTVVLDQKAIGYKGDIQEFEKRLGKGDYIITIISDKYLKSEHCMNEMLNIERKERVYNRIFPIVLDDARGIYQPLERLQYKAYWKTKTEELEKALKQHGFDGGLEVSVRDLNRWQQINLIIGNISSMLSNMNALTPEKHLNNDFSELITEIDKQIQSDKKILNKEHQSDLLVRSLHDQIKPLTFAKKVFHDFSSPASSYEIFKKVIDQGVDTLKADVVFFHIYSDQDKSLVRVTQSEFHIKDEKVQSLFGSDLSVAATEFILNFLHSEESPSCLISGQEKNNNLDSIVHSLIVAPVKIRDKIFGVASAFSFNSDKIFDEIDKNAMDFIAERAASAIEGIALYENIYDNLFAVFDTLVKIIELKDFDTKRHSERVAKHAHLIAKEMGCTEEELDNIDIAGNLHDIGKIGIRDDILLKTEKLTEEEYEILKDHSIIGADIIGKTGLWDIEMEIVRHHHERYDGKGYPDGLIGKEIPFLARILFVAECFDAMTSDTVYRKKIEKQRVVEWISKNAGSWFDPKVVNTFIKLEKAGIEIKL